MSCGVYRIYSKATNEAYIGSSSNIEARLATHKTKFKTKKHPNQKLQEIFNQHGIDNLLFEILELCAHDKLEEREKFYINLIGKNINIQMNDHEKNRKIYIGMDADFLSVNEFAKLINVHPQTVRRSIKNGHINAFKTGIGKSTLRIPISEINRMAIVNLEKIIDKKIEERM